MSCLVNILGLGWFITCSIEYSSVADPGLFIPDPDPALNFPSSGLGSGYRQKFWIHADLDPDPAYIIKIYLDLIKTP